MSATSLSERPLAQMALGKAEGVLSPRARSSTATATEAWERTAAGRASTKEEKGKLMLAAVNLMQSCVEAVDYVRGVAGTSGIYTRSPLERAFRDVHTARHHRWVSETRYGTYGQIALGLEPDFPVALFGPTAEGEEEALNRPRIAGDSKLATLAEGERQASDSAGGRVARREPDVLPDVSTSLYVAIEAPARETGPPLNFLSLSL